MKKLALTLAVMLMSGIVALQAKTASQIRVYINPGHGAWCSNCRPQNIIREVNGTLKTITTGSSTTTGAKPDTTAFYESNTNLWKCLAIVDKLEQYGLKIDRTKNRTNSNAYKVGAALDFSNNICMSRTKTGPYPIDNSNAVCNKSLSTICAEANANNFDLFISVHSNANTDPSTANYLAIFYRGYSKTGGDKVPGSIAASQAAWPHLFSISHHKWTARKSSALNTGVIGDLSFYNTTSTTGYLGALKHNVPGYLAEGYFHTYRPARQRHMQRKVDVIEGYMYARGAADYFGLTKESTGDIYGVVRSTEQFNNSWYSASSSTPDIYTPLNGVTVVLKKNGTEVSRMTTDNHYNGAFVFTNLATGTYTVTMSKTGYQTTTSTVTVQAAKTACPELYMTPGESNSLNSAPLDNMTEKWNFSHKRNTVNQKGYDATKIRNFCYNDGKLYCVYNHTEIKVLDAQTGDELGTLNNGSVVGPGTLPLCDVKAVDGKIIACNLAVASANQELRLYCWDNDTAEPQLLKTISDLRGAARLGDCMEISGSFNGDMHFAFANDDNTTTRVMDFYRLNGANWNGKYYSVTTNGSTRFASGVTTRAVMKNGGWWIDGAGSRPGYFTLNSSNVAVKQYGLETGLNWGSAVREFTWKGDKYIAATVFNDPSSNSADNYKGGRARLLVCNADECLNPINVADYPSDGLSETTKNGNVTSDVVVNTDGNNWIEMWVNSTNHGICYYSYGNPPAHHPQPFDPLVPLITPAQSSVSMSSLIENTATATVSVEGTLLTSAISVSLSGTDASMFSINKTSLGTSGGSVTITYAPTAAGTHNAVLTFASNGAVTKTVSITGTATEPITAPDLVQKNAYAYDIEINPGDNAFEKIVSYKLNGKTSAVTIKLYDGDTEVASYAGTTKQSNEVPIDLRSVGTGTHTTLTAKVFVTTKTPVTAPRKISDKTSGMYGSASNGRWRFFAPWSITVNNVTGSNTFGRIVVAEAKYDPAIGFGTTAGTSSIYHSSVASSGASGRGAMLYAFDPQFMPIPSTESETAPKYGFCADLDLTLAKLNVKYSTSDTEVVHTFSQVRYSLGGSLFFSSANSNYKSIYKFSNPSLLGGSTVSIFDSSKEATHQVRRVNAFDLQGQGNALQIIVLSNATGSPVPSDAGFNVCTHTVGPNSNIGTAPSHYRNCFANNTKNEFLQKIAFDPDGNGFYLSRRNGTTATHYRHQLITDGVAVLPSTAESITDNYTRSGAVAYNRTGTLMARQEGAGKIVVYQCTSPYGSSALTQWCEVTFGDGDTDVMSGAFETINDLAFDYANNLYIASVSQGVVTSVQIPNPDGATISVPVRSGYNISGYNGNSSITVTNSFDKYSRSNTVSWTATNVPDAVKYNIYRNGTLVGNVNAGVTTFADNIDAEGNFSYVVKAVNKNNREIVASPAKVLNAAFPALALNISYDPEGDVDLVWQATNLDEATSYVIYRDDLQLISKGATDRQHSVSASQITDPHEYYVEARNAQGELIKSNTVMLGLINPNFYIEPDLGETVFSDNGITRLNAIVEWNRPTSQTFTDAATGEYYVLSHYELTLLDKDGNSIDITGADVSITIDGVTYTAEVTDHDNDNVMEINDPITNDILTAGPSYVGGGSAPVFDEEVSFRAVYPNYDIDFSQYTMVVTPIYVNASDEDDTLTSGAVASNSAVQTDEIFTEPRNMKVTCFKSHSNDAYRVDIDFDKPNSEMPVSYYRLDWRNQGDEEWTEIGSFYAVKGNEQFFFSGAQPMFVRAMYAGQQEGDGDGDSQESRISFAEGVDNGWILGTYDFEHDKAYALPQPEDEAEPCVVYFYTVENPLDKEFRTTAYYGASNAVLLDAEETNVPAVAIPENGLVMTGISSAIAGINNIVAYPVPSYDIVNIEAPEAICEVKVFNAAGALVMAEKFDESADNKVSINIEALATGNYIVIVNSTYRARIVKK